jgi:TrmH family RNA methyltransferase
MKPFVITSAANPHVKLARKLHRKRHRDREGLCLLEGVRLVRDAWQAGVLPRLVFVSSDYLGSRPAVQALVDDLVEAGARLLPCSPEIFATISETVTPQGIAAIVPIPKLSLPQHLGLILMLDRVREPGNAGTLLRSAAAAGVDLVIFGPETVDPYNGKVLRAAMGAHFRVPLHICSQWIDVKAILPQELNVYVADAGATRVYDEVDWSQPSALVVGGEAAGPSPEARDIAIPIAIPMENGIESLNAAVAGSVILFEAALQRRRGKRNPL